MRTGALGRRGDWIKALCAGRMGDVFEVAEGLSHLVVIGIGAW